MEITSKQFEVFDRYFVGCACCKKSCMNCVFQHGWGTTGKPKICLECEDLSNYNSEDNFCYNCGKPLNENGLAIFLDRISKNTQLINLTLIGIRLEQEE